MSLFGSMGPIVKAIGLPPIVIVNLRAWISALFLFFYMKLTKRSFKQDEVKKYFVPLVVSGFFFLCDWLGLFAAYNHISVADATVIYYFAPIMIIIGCSVFMNEKLSIKGIVCIVLSFIGLILVSGASFDNTNGKSDIIGIAFSLLGAVSYAAIVLINRRYPEGDPVIRTTIQLFVAAVLTTPYVLLTNDFSVLHVSVKSIVLLLVLGIGLTALTYVFYFRLIVSLPSRSVAICSYADPLVSVFVSILLLGEPMTLQGMIGSVLIIGSSLASEINKH